MKKLKNSLTVVLLLITSFIYSQDNLIEQDNFTDIENFSVNEAQKDTSSRFFIGFKKRKEFEKFNLRNKLTETNFNDNMYLKGMADAEKYYFKYRGTGTVTVINTIIFSPVGGALTAVLIAGREPAPESWVVPNIEYLKSADYREGYAKQAKLKRTRNVWKNWAITTSIIVVGGSLGGIIYNNVYN